MLRYARECRPTEIEVTLMDRPFSNFAFIDDRFSQIGPLRRILSQVRAHGAKTMVFESLDPANAQDLSEENEDIEKRFSQSLRSEVWRLSFFRKSFSTTRGLVRVSEEDFLGYAILKQDVVAGGAHKARVYESVLRPSRRENNFIRGEPTWSCRVHDQTFTVSGYLYAQQNTWTNCCAHVACRTAAARFHNDGDMTYREMNAVPSIPIDHVKRKAEDGLTNVEMAAILEVAGARCFVAKYMEPTAESEPPPFQKYLYGSIESGYPAILFFATERCQYHAIPVFGHTFNEDMWVPSAEMSYFRVGARRAWVPSEQWLSTFVGHDDNWGSNYCIPRHFLHARTNCKKWPEGPTLCQMQSDCVCFVIASLPKDVEVNPIVAEVIAADYLSRLLPEIPDGDSPWRRRLEEYNGRNLLVLRPILVDTLQYSDHLGIVSDWSGNRVPQQLFQLLKSLPFSRIWVVELSVPELFSANRRKLGEVVIFADEPPKQERDFRNFLLARVPGYFAFRTGGDEANPEFSFVASGLRDHVALIGSEDFSPA